MAGFHWRVAKAGYEWVDRYRTPKLEWGRGVCRKPTLIAIDWIELSERCFKVKPVAGPDASNPENWRCEYRTYEPLKEHSGLFQTFANIKLSLKGIRAFANAYGHLGEGETWPLQVTKENDFESDEERETYEFTRDFTAVPNTYNDWKSAILSMRQAVGLWQQYRESPKDEVVARELQSAVDYQLLDVRAVACFQLVPRLKYQPALHLQPYTLLGAMWIQLALAISGNKELLQCPECCRWFEMTPDVTRSTRLYCSDACRSRAYRTRKNKAAELRVEGKSVAQIAEILGCKVKNVASWLKTRKG